MASTSPGQNVTWEDVDVSRPPRIIFLLIFMLASFIGSIFIIIVIAQNVRLRTVQNLLIVNMCVVCMVDATFNMTLVVGALLVNKWNYGGFVCKLNLFLMNLVAIETVLTLTAFSIDRHLSLRFSHKYEVWLSSYRFALALAYLWIHSTAFSIPFLSEAVISTYRPQLHLCAVSGETPLAFICSTLLVCFLLPVITMIVFQIINTRLYCKLRYLKRGEISQKNYTQISNEKSTFLSNSHPSSMSAILFILWLILELPFVITSYIRQYEYSQRMEKEPLLSYPWELDAVFIWMRFFFSAVFPFLTFFCKKEIWQYTKECALCRPNNSITDMETNGAITHSQTKVLNDHVETPKLERNSFSPKVKLKEKEKELIEGSPQQKAFTVPVLFATSTGICIEDYEKELAVETDMDIGSSTVSLTKHTCKALDITYQEHEYVYDLMGDTSDYDSSSEIDKYSNSQPVSARNVHDNVHRSRSMSEPELKAAMAAEKALGLQNVTQVQQFSGTSGADSGLDLSGTAGSSLERSTKVHSRNKNDFPALSKVELLSGNDDTLVRVISTKEKRSSVVQRLSKDASPDSPSTEETVDTAESNEGPLPHKLKPIEMNGGKKPRRQKRFPKTKERNRDVEDDKSVKTSRARMGHEEKVIKT